MPSVTGQMVGYVAKWRCLECGEENSMPIHTPQEMRGVVGFCLKCRKQARVVCNDTTPR